MDALLWFDIHDEEIPVVFQVSTIFLRIEQSIRDSKQISEELRHQYRIFPIESLIEDN